MEFIEPVREFLIAIGPLGLGLLGLIDSAGAPTGGGPDLGVLVLASQQQAWLWVGIAVLATTIGSTAGCFLLYLAGQKGGRRSLTRFEPMRWQKVRNYLDRYGFWAIFVAMLGPPPFPTKLFVLCAGVFNTHLTPVLAGVFFGRLLRYAVVGYFSFLYGSKAIGLIADQALAIFVGLMVLGLATVLLNWLRQRRFFAGRQAYEA